MKKQVYSLIASVDTTLIDKIEDDTDILELLNSLQIIKLLILVEETYEMEIDFDTFEISLLNSAIDFYEFILNGMKK